MPDVSHAKRILLGVVPIVLAVLAAIGLNLSTEAQAQPVQPRSADGLEIVAHSDLGQSIGDTSDVWLLGDTAFVGYYSCNSAVGSSVVDVSDPANPTVLFHTEPMSMTFANDVKAISLTTPDFQGDLFIEPHERCSSSSGPPAEIRFFDVTDPDSPTLLGSFVTGDGVHNVYAFQRGETAYLLLAAANADRRDWGDDDLATDFAIVDITDPSQPSLVSEWKIEDHVQDLEGSVFLHDVWASDDGTLAYAAYWDAGLIVLDISDVTAPTVASRVTYPAGAEGNTHAAIPFNDGDYVVITDEDFDPTEGHLTLTAPPALAGELDHAYGSFGAPLLDGTVVEGDVVWVGRGCAADPADNIPEDDPYLGDPTGAIAAIVRGECSFSNKVLRAQDAGAIGAIIVNHNQSGGVVSLGGRRADVTIPAAGIAYDDGHTITTTLEAGTAVSARMALSGGEWGFTRIADLRDPSQPRLISEITLPETREFPPASGRWSVHNPWIQDDTLALSHYSGGVRLVDISDPAQPQEIAHLVPPDTVNDQGDEYHASIWGVVMDPEGLVYASDMLGGLWILGAVEPSQDTPTPTDTQVPTVVPPPAATATPLPTLVPPPTPGAARACPHIQNGKVPAAAIAAALANPGRVRGYMQPLNPAKPVHEIWNPRRTYLSILAYSKPYHPTWNPLVFKAGCP